MKLFKDLLQNKALWLLTVSIVLYVVFNNKNVQNHGCELVVYSYSSWIQEWGPGPELAKKFNQREDCHVELVDAGHGREILDRARLAPESKQIDILMGYDQWALQDFKEISLKTKNITNEWVKEFEKSNDEFEHIPFDWAPMSFIYKISEIKKPPTTFKDLLESKYKVSIMNPRSSSTGFQFLTWLYLAMDESWYVYAQKFMANKPLLSSSWSASYGLFKKGVSNLTFSYLTSPVYHWSEENNFDYQAVVFKEGHVAQVEYMSILQRCKNCEMAEKWINFILELEAQKIIMMKNYMFPVTKGVVEGTLFEKLPKVKIIPQKNISVKKLIRQWESL